MYHQPYTKRTALAVTVLLLAGLLAGCVGAGNPGQSATPSHGEKSTAPVASATPGPVASADPTTATATFPIPDFYFSNMLEEYRLYKLSEDGLSLVWDTYLYSAVRADGCLVYQRDGAIRKMDIATMEETVLADTHSYYLKAEGKYAYYAASEWNEEGVGISKLYCINLDATEVTTVGLYDDGPFVAIDGKLYYAEPAEGVGNRLMCYDPQTKQSSQLLAEGIYNDLCGWNGLVFFRDTHSWQCYDIHTGETSLVAGVGLDRTDLLYADGSCIFYAEWDQGECELKLLDAQTEQTVASSRAGPYILDVQDGKLLVRTTSGNTSGWDHFVLDFKSKQMMPLALLGECGQMFAMGDFPRIDTSTARKPIALALYDLFVWNQGHEGVEPISSKTHGAWLNIADRKVDLALLVKPTKDEETYLAQQNVQVEMKPYGGDSLAFIGHPSLGVESLTGDQIRGIYSGQITNWSQVGGPDHAIEAYYRNEESGSQRLFESLVWKDHELPDFNALSFYEVDDMDSIVNICARSPYAIGYTLSTYVTNYEEDALRRFAVDGILPTAENVANESYPYSTVGYVIIRADEPQDSPARRLYDWFGCPISDEIIRANGMVPIH